jgi:hypothetical protein
MSTQGKQEMHIAFIVAGGVLDADTVVNVDPYSAELGSEIIDNYSESLQAPKDSTIADAKIITQGYIRTGSWVWVNDSVNSAMDNGIWAAVARPWGGEGNQR